MNQIQNEDHGNILKFASKLYNFDIEDIQKQYYQHIQKEKEGNALRELEDVPNDDRPPKKVDRRPKHALPWTGVVIPNCCQALRANYGTYTQCIMLPLKGKMYCKTCQKNADQSSDGIPPSGNVEMRGKVGVNDFKDPAKGKKPVAYSSIIGKFKSSKQEIIEEAGFFGINIDESFLTIQKKNITCVSDSEDSEECEIKTNGRPKKEDHFEPNHIIQTHTANEEEFPLEDDESDVISPKKQVFDLSPPSSP